jgi:hypothetical protein
MKKESHLIFSMAVMSILLTGVAIFATSRIIASEKNNNGLNERAEVENNKNDEKKEEIKSTKEELKPEVKLKIEEKEKEQNQNQEKEENKNIEKEEKKESKEVKIKGIVEDAKEVEYKLIKEGSVEPKIYLGKGEMTNKETEEEGEEWSLEYDFSNVPNGNYELYADVKNDYGTYSSGKTAIKVEDETGVEAKEENLTNDQNQIENSSIVVNNSRDNASSSDSASQKLKEIQKIEEEIKNDSSLGEEQKQEKLTVLSQEKLEIKEEFNFRKQAEQLLAKEDGKNLSEEEKRKFQEIKNTLKVDSDGDGLPDYEEERIGSDPFSADSDQDGYLDGDEVKNGYNPLLAASEKGADKIVFQEPKVNGQENSFYRVEKVEAQKEENNSEKITGVKMSGKALPNSFITLYIYSDPVVVTVKTDEDGNWSYILDKELEDGHHEVYGKSNIDSISNGFYNWIFTKQTRFRRVIR